MNDHQLTTCRIVFAIATEATVSFVYYDEDDVMSVRRVKPYSIHRCANGQTCVRAWDTQRDAPRCFRLNRIWNAVVA